MHARCCWRSIYYNDNYYDSAMLASQTLLASLHKDHILLGSDPKIWIWISADRKSVGLTVVGTAQTNRFVASIVCNQNSSRRERKETLLHTINFLFFWWGLRFGDLYEFQDCWLFWRLFFSFKVKQSSPQTSIELNL